jgi:xylulokinase
MNQENKEYVIGIDAGTSDLRAVVFDKVGREIAQSRTPYDTFYPNLGWAEQDANDWAKAFKSTVKNLFTDHGVKPESVKALGITHQRETFVPVNKKGQPLRKAMLWFDARSSSQVEWLKNQIDQEEVIKITGVPISSGWSSTKILWIKDNEREIFDQAYKFLLVSDFLTFISTGNFKTSWASACTTQLFDINTFEWSKRLLNVTGIPISKLPDAIPPGQMLGKVTKDFADSTSLIEDTPIVAGGGDQQCGGLGTGVIKKGIASLNLGTSVIIETFLDKPVIDRQRRYWLRLACLPKKYAAENGIGGGAYTLKWFKENFSQSENKVADELKVSTYDVLMLEAEKAPPGSLGLMLVPYWLGVITPYFDSNARGIMVGFTGSHRREHFIRAIIEGVSYEVRLNLENMEDASKMAVQEIRVYGGGAKSSLWCQIIADICNKKVIVTQTEENTALGAAVLAASSVFYKDIKKAVKNMVHPTAEYNPIMENVMTYDRLYKKVYKSLYTSLRHLFKEFAT